jgi:hypothetical protein
VQIGALRQLLLTEGPGFAMATNFPPQSLKVCVCVHPARCRNPKPLTLHTASMQGRRTRTNFCAER